MRNVSNTGVFTHPTVGRIGFEFAVSTGGSDAQVVSFAPEHDDYPEAVDYDDAPADWRILAEQALPFAVSEYLCQWEARNQ